MANCFHDEDVTYHKYHQQWTVEQNKLQKRVRIKDMFNWEIPNRVEIKYAQNSSFGSVSLKKRSNMNLNEDSKEKEPLRYIGGVDISFTKPGSFEYDKACAGLMIHEYPSMRLVHEETAIVTLKHPYIAGFLAFREVDPLIDLIKKVKKHKPQFTPQVILVDGNGYLHYRRIGLASHLSVVVKIPCIGVAKKLLAVAPLRPQTLVPDLNKRLKKVGAFCDLYAHNYEQIGYALRTHETEDVVYVSPGSMISFESSLKIVVLCMDKHNRYKLPIPTEKADFVTRRHIRRYEREHGNHYAYNYRQNDDYKQQYNNNDTNGRSSSYQSKRGNSGNKQKNKPKQVAKYRVKAKADQPQNGHNHSNNKNNNNHDDVHDNQAVSKSAKRRNRKRKKQWQKATNV